MEEGKRMARDDQGEWDARGEGERKREQNCKKERGYKNQRNDIRRLRDWEREFQGLDAKPQKSPERSRGRSRRRKGGQGGQMALTIVTSILVLLLLIVLFYGGFRFYQRWSGESGSASPLESSREIAPESMGASE